LKTFACRNVYFQGFTPPLENVSQVYYIRALLTRDSALGFNSCAADMFTRKSAKTDQVWKLSDEDEGEETLKRKALLPCYIGFTRISRQKDTDQSHLQ
jgi:hypothetical protein